MSEPNKNFRRRLMVLIGLLTLSIAGCVALAIFATRNARHTVSRLAEVELRSAQLVRDFRRTVDELHHGLLQIGEDGPVDSAAIMTRRESLAQWMRDRHAAPHGEAERAVLARLDAELENYFKMLDALAARPGGLNTPLPHAMIVQFDAQSMRLAGFADDFDTVHDTEERALLASSLAAVQRLRNVVFVCLGLLVVAAGAVSALLYRDLVQPLRMRLIESQELLAKREKLAALGTLAAGVAHEIRNPLTAIKARLFTLRRATPVGDARDDVQAIAQEIDRLESIVRDVLGYARPAEPKFVDVELAEWLQNLVKFQAPALQPRGVAMMVDAPAAVAVQADPAHLQQIILNLVGNAADAFDGRPGRITLAVRAARWGERSQPTEGALLSVKDNGPGIPLDLHDRLFDPFFTTKASGTGLGLSIVARLVEEHGGRISFQSAPGAGTTFEVRLPRQPPRTAVT